MPTVTLAIYSRLHSRVHSRALPCPHLLIREQYGIQKSLTFPSQFPRGKGERRPPSECLFLACLFLEQLPVFTLSAPVSAVALAVGATTVVFQ